MYTAIATEARDNPMVKTGNDKLKYSSHLIPPNTPAKITKIILKIIGRKFGDPAPTGLSCFFDKLRLILSSMKR